MLRKIARLTGVVTAVFAVLPWAAARAALECDQVVAVAHTTVKLRDEGASLNGVMREIESGELQQKLDVQELNLLRQIVRLSFTSEASVHEILEACKAGELGLPKPKSKP